MLTQTLPPPPPQLSFAKYAFLKKNTSSRESGVNKQCWSWHDGEMGKGQNFEEIGNRCVSKY